VRQRDRPLGRRRAEHGRLTRDPGPACTTIAGYCDGGLPGHRDSTGWGPARRRATDRDQKGMTMGVAHRATRMYLAAVTAALAIPALVACGSGQGHITGGTPTGSSPSAGAEPGVDTYLCSGSGQDTLLQWQDLALGIPAGSFCEMWILVGRKLRRPRIWW